jgi:predicted unusual protein kinase regulating ubiquinone biosynthesis (AarF/ABC1/UbiB family)
MSLLWICFTEGIHYLCKQGNVERFWHRCMEVDVLYTKFFQSISGHYLYSSVHTIPYKPEEFQPTLPVKKILGSGFISIVYESELHGNPVVVKTKRIGIEDKIQDSITNLQWYLDTIHRWYKIPTLLLAFFEIKQGLLVQLDYIQEVKNHKHFQSVCDYSYIRTPMLFESECNETQIVMTRLHGVPVSSLTKDQLQKQVWNLTEMMIQMLTKKGCIHGDLHLGNIMFQEDSLGILDFGFIIELTNEERDHMFELVKGLLLQDYLTAAEHTLSFIEGDLTSAQKENSIVYIIHVYQKSMELNHCFSVYNIYELNTKLSKYNVHFRPLFYKIIMALHSVETLVCKLSNPDTLAGQLAILLCHE